VATGAKMMQLFNSMSSPSFLLANDTNHTLLRSLLESMNSILEHQFKSELLSGLVQLRTYLTVFCRKPRVCGGSREE
jgi:hypothetical protein